MYYLLPIFVGILLSLLGGGGSILSVPLLHYFFEKSASVSTAYSLFTVGVCSLVAGFYYYFKGLASLKTALYFSFPSFAMVFIMRKFIMPLIPENIYFSDVINFSKDSMILVVFSLLIILASTSMIKTKSGNKDNTEALKRKLNYKMVFFEGMVVGIMTGFVGVGGGFLIIPVLVNFIKLPIQMAVGTSLLIIAINSVFGFLGDLGVQTMDWQFLIQFLGLNLFGVLIGLFISSKIENKETLKKAFGYFLIFIGMFILIKEILI